MNPQEMEIAVLKLSRQQQQSPIKQYMEAHSQNKNFVQYQDLAKYHQKQKGKLSLHLKETTLTLNSKNIAPVKS